MYSTIYGIYVMLLQVSKGIQGPEYKGCINYNMDFPLVSIMNLFF